MIIRPTHPLISCICITDNRPELLAKSIASYYAQGYPNKELVISYPVSDQVSEYVIHEALSLNKELNILVVVRPDHYTIGKSRNDAIAKCNGGFICTWDDDDWYFPNRIAHQFNNLKSSGKFFEASILTQIFLFDSQVGKIYSSFPYYWAGSLVCKKDYVLKYPYLDANIAEDVSLIKFLTTENLLYEIDDAHYLYAYCYHGQNIIDYFHFQYLIRNSVLLDEENLVVIKELIEANYLICDPEQLAAK